jgi:hypothetical protein
MRSAGECERASETSVDVGHQPVRQETDAHFERATVDRGELCDVDNRIGVKLGDDVSRHQDIAWQRGEPNVAREHRHSDGRQLGSVVLVGADDQYRMPQRGSRTLGQAEVGAGRGEVSAERVAHRNGYRARPWETRVGEIELLIPRKRQGPAYFPSFLEPRRRSEQAIVAVVLEAYVNGVSTQKVDRLVEQLGIVGMTKDRVSALCRALDEQVTIFRERPLEGNYPYVWLDAKHLKVRSDAHVRSKALVIAYAVHDSGVREVIGLDLGEVESEAFWVEFLRSLRARGLQGVRLAVSDQHKPAR